MSLTEREKDIALDLGIPADKANAFLSRIREEQEAVAFIEPVKSGMEHLACCENASMLDQEVIDNWIPLFTTPPANDPKEHDFSELVEALENIRISHRFSFMDKQDCVDVAEKALANHAKRMKGE